MAPDATPSLGALSLADTVLVSNRGPLAFHEENGRPVPGTVGGGLAGSLHPLVVGTGATWVACALSRADRAAAAAGLMIDDGLLIELVDPDPDRYSMAYNVISNATLWYCHHHLFDAARRPAPIVVGGRRGTRTGNSTTSSPIRWPRSPRKAVGCWCRTTTSL